MQHEGLYRYCSKMLRAAFSSRSASSPQYAHL
jgi:hypothetical protein